MKKFECNDCGGHCSVTMYRDYIMPCCCLHDKTRVDWHEVKEETTTNCSQLPKLTEEVFDRPECPAWANYAAVDKFSKGFYFRSEPKKTDHAWKLPLDHKMVNIGNFDPSDWQNSLIKRPEKVKLPDWCKVGEWVYEVDSGKYQQINVITETEIGFMSEDVYDKPFGDFEPYYYSRARKRPFNAEEMQKLVGQIIIGKDNTLLVNGHYRKEKCIGAGISTYLDAEDLMCYTCDGEPCYKLEYLNDKGEWVE